MEFLSMYQIDEALWVSIVRAPVILSTGDHEYCYSVKLKKVDSRYVVYEAMELGVKLFDTRDEALAEFNRLAREREQELATAEGLASREQLVEEGGE